MAKPPVEVNDHNQWEGIYRPLIMILKKMHPHLDEEALTVLEDVIETADREMQKILDKRIEINTRLMEMPKMPTDADMRYYSRKVWD